MLSQNGDINLVMTKGLELPHDSIFKDRGIKNVRVTCAAIPKDPEPGRSKHK